MGKWRSAVLFCWPLALAVWCPPAAADGPPALNSPAVAVRQGFSPFGMALTGDGRYAYLSFDLSPFVFKVRLSDMTVVASADFSRYYPLQCSSIALDAGESKVFLYDHTLGRLLVLDAATLQEIQMIGGFPTFPAELVRSRWGPYLILVSGWVWLLNTDTLEVTALGNSVALSHVRESATDSSLWYAVSSTPDGTTTIGTYDYKKALWSAKATVQHGSGDWGVHDFEVLPGGSKAYLAVLGPSLPNDQVTGWLYGVDLRSGTVTQQTVDGGALALTLNADGSRLYVGAGWPALVNGSGPLILTVDTGTDAVSNVLQVGPQKFGWKCTQTNDLKLDPAGGKLLYATNSDGNSLVKVDLATNQVAAYLVLNDESNSPSSFVREPGTSRGYVLLSRTNEALEVDLDSGEVTRTVQLPLDFSSPGAAFRDANTLLVAQGNYILELAADLTLRARHNLPSGTPAIWRVLASRDGKTVYSVSQAQGTESTYQPNLLVAIDAASFQIKATLQLAGGSFDLPWEHPDAGKLYFAGGISNGPVAVQVVNTADYSLRKTIQFNDSPAPGASFGINYPYAYDPGSRTLFVGTKWAILAIDTDRDEIKSVIRLDGITAAMGISQYSLTILNVIGLAFDPGSNRLYIAHLDGSFVNAYDLTKNQFLPQLIPLKGYMPDVLVANDDLSKLLALDMRSDQLSVIDTKAGVVTKLIDIHACNPFPGSVSFQAGGKTSQTVTLSGLKTTGACTASTPAAWLSATPASTSAPQTFNVSADASVFGAGTYHGAVTFQSASLSVAALDAGLTVGSGASSVRVAGVADGAGFGPVIAPGAWASVMGSNLAPATRIWRPDEIVEGVLPTSVEGVGVTVNGRSAAVYAVSPSQINFQVPGSLADGTVQVAVVNNGAPSNTISATLAQSAPELFRFLPSAYAVALHTSYRIAASPGLFPGCTDATLCPASEAAPGETIILYATGLGATTPVSPAGTLIGAPVPVANAVQVRFGNTAVSALAWLVSAGLYQINVTVPGTQPDGDVALTVSVGGTASTVNTLLTAKRTE